MKKYLIVLSSSFLCAEYNATSVAQTLNISYQDYNFLMGLSGNLIGFTMLITLALIAKG